jgi:amino acid efflux transporter
VVRSRIGPLYGAAVSVSAVLGTGIIALPALGAAIAGPASLIAWVALILLSAPLAATLAALGGRYPDSGGISTYVRLAFGRRPAAVVGWWFYFVFPVGAPAAILFGGAYVADAVGGGDRTMLLTGVGLIAAVTTTNWFGFQISGRVQLALAATLIAFLGITVIVALPHAHVGNLRPFAPHGWMAVGEAATVLVWGFVGWEAVANLTAEFDDPRRSVPQATAIAAVVVSLVYLAVAVTTLTVLGPAAGESHAPLSALLATAIPGQVRPVAAVVAVVLTAGVMNAYFASVAKLGAALGRDGALPAWFASGSQAGGTPRRSLTVLAVMATAAFFITEYFHIGVSSLVRYATGSFTLVYVLGVTAAVRLLPRRSWARLAAAAALLFVIALVILNVRYIGWAAGVALAALVYDRLRRPSPVGVPVED